MIGPAPFVTIATLLPFGTGCQFSAFSDAVADNRPDLVGVWNAIRQDKEHHLQMLREALVGEARKDNLK